MYSEGSLKSICIECFVASNFESVHLRFVRSCLSSFIPLDVQTNISVQQRWGKEQVGWTFGFLFLIFVEFFVRLAVRSFGRSSIFFDFWWRATHRRQKSKKMLNENLACFSIFGGVLRTAAKNRKKCLTKTWHFFRFLAACYAPPPKIEKNA